jgi:hypothetical protein
VYVYYTPLCSILARDRVEPDLLQHTTLYYSLSLERDVGLRKCGLYGISLTILVICYISLIIDAVDEKAHNSESVSSSSTKPRNIGKAFALGNAFAPGDNYLTMANKVNFSGSNTVPLSSLASSYNPTPHVLSEGENAAPLEGIGCTATDSLVIVMVGVRLA